MSDESAQVEDIAGMATSGCGLGRSSSREGCLRIQYHGGDCTHIELLVGIINDGLSVLGLYADDEVQLST